MKDKLIKGCKEYYINLCREFIAKFMAFGIESSSLTDTKKLNRVELKKAVLNATRGKSLTQFISWLGIGEKEQLKVMMHMECPVVCPSRKEMLTPVESMPANVMKASKRLRNFFGIPEVQICRSCAKRVRCRKYQQAEQGVPHLSDLASVLIGLHSTCKLTLQGSSLVLVESSFKELPSAMVILDSLSSYLKVFSTRPMLQRGDEKRCEKIMKKHMKMSEMNKMLLLKEKAFNIPEHFSAKPTEETYMSGFQREVYTRLQKGAFKKSDEYIWLSDTSDTTSDSEASRETPSLIRSLNKVDYQPLGEGGSANIYEPRSTEQLDTEGVPVQFRLHYSVPIGNDVSLVRYDISQDCFIQGIKINSKARVVIDLKRHKDDEEGAIKESHGVEMYRPGFLHKPSFYEGFMGRRPTNFVSLSFIKKVPYSYQCQSTGDISGKYGRKNGVRSGNMQNIAIALSSPGGA